jgi:cytochrome c oxidase subunit II
VSGNQNVLRVDRYPVRRRRHTNRTRLLLASGITLVMALGAVACESDDAVTPSGGGAATSGSVVPGEASASNGEALARTKGCAGCHGQDFKGGVGPGWVGLAGSTVNLADGTTVVADDVYLTAAIKNPSAQTTDGYNLKMPPNNLTDAEVADIVAFIGTLGDG